MDHATWLFQVIQEKIEKLIKMESLHQPGPLGLAQEAGPQPNQVDTGQEH